MKYSADIDPENANTSHGIIVDLVGSEKRVLDVGCAYGFLAEALGRHDNTVSGVDIDPDVADRARPHLERLVIGDLEQLDLVDLFGEHSFDVVVYADVLEHLKDPVPVLRQARDLLAPGGYVIVSIPNVAHASVRLALLQGRFEYRELGLLDDTHLRFFTRSSVVELLRNGGFVATDMRRTVAPILGTEIRLSPGDFSPETLTRVEADPDSTTYQFVIKAAPVGTGAGVDALVATVIAREREAHDLRGQLAAIASHLGNTPQRAQLGVLDAGDPAEPPGLRRLRVAATLLELRRRLAGVGMRVYGLQHDVGETALSDELIHPLLPWDPTRATRLAAEVDALVVITPPAGIDGLREMLADVAEAGCPVHVLAVDAVLPVDAVLAVDAVEADGPGPIREGVVTKLEPPTVRSEDPTVVAGRLLSVPFLLQRAELLRLVGTVPDSRFVFVHLTARAEEKTHEAALWRAVASVARRAGADTVALVPEAAALPPDVRSLDWDGSPIDLLTAAAAAVLVITDSAALIGLVTGLGRPVLGVDGAGTTDPGPLRAWQHRGLVTAATPDDLVAAAGTIGAEDHNSEGQDGALADRITGSVDLCIDDLAERVVPAIGRRLVHNVPARLATLNDEVAVLEMANGALRTTLVRERRTFAAHADALRHQLEREPVAEPGRRGDRLVREELAQAHREIARLQREIEYIYATRTMRAVQPARRLYGRLRTFTK